jgi:leucyl-tRNA synthetase
MRFNTAGAKLIELNNHVTKAYAAQSHTPRVLVEGLVQMLAPLAPHVADELWSRLGHEDSLAHGPFPVAEERYLVEDTVEYPIQVNGKVRSRVVVAAMADRDDVRSAALADEKIVALTGGAEPRKVIVVPGKLVNVVL